MHALIAALPEGGKGRARGLLTSVIPQVRAVHPTLGWGSNACRVALDRYLRDGEVLRAVRLQTARRPAVAICYRPAICRGKTSTLACHGVERRSRWLSRIWRNVLRTWACSCRDRPLFYEHVISRIKFIQL